MFGGTSFRYAYFRFLYGTEIDYIKTKSNKQCKQCQCFLGLHDNMYDNWFNNWYYNHLTYSIQ